jgi:hypothetical protein
METEEIYEIVVFNLILTRLIVRQDFNVFIRRENFKSNIANCFLVNFYLFSWFLSQLVRRIVSFVFN